MQASMSRYTSLFQEAAKVVDETEQHPGQSIPGYWEMSDETSWPVLIGVIMSNAINEVCRRQPDCVFEHALERLVEVTSGVPMVVKGDPAQIAANRLRLAAQANFERVETAVERLTRLASLAAGELKKLAPNDVELERLAKDIRVAIGDAKHVRLQ
ncbi:hypothetical protein CcrC1_gp272 [Caulobacter phage C1]|nr:hypothetical protein CcrC1_gp272 [Caulobacter phage C1]UTU08501.1 hypothetical protein CcrC2_gp273 [Caulobacter phage C2]UTU09016.1 hypothetical protein CcrJ4_gp267 [Caulobacter phage J4]UTU09577.1 hypothetical protein CcrBL47_gp291 [Caulobacter phage BL47]UTU10134.1 hypothetical protein CcrRB23_gp272 [Caulobacter phage RB23]WGN97168.1 hypothetical protein [Bertelyvirus sp.]